jgi:hypothetical protein
MAAVVPMFVASPAGAANQCDAGQFPSTFAAQSGLKVACHTDAATSATHIEIHDGANAVWHHGAAHNVSLVGSPSSFTAASTVLKFASGTIKNTDVRRPINAFCTKNATAGNNNCATAVAKDSVFAGGTFIAAVLPAGCTTACTSATLSQKAKLTGGTSALPIIAVIDQTNNRYLDDVTCAAAGSTITSATAKWAATDVNKSVSGGPLTDGTFIVSVAGNVATLNQSHTSACTAAPGHTGDQISVGGTTYSGGNPQVFNNDPMSIQLSNTTGGGQGFTCTGGAGTLAMTAGAKTNTGGFNAAYIGLTVFVKGTAATPTTAKITAVNVAGNTSATIAPVCPAGVTATNGFAAVSTAAPGAPKNNAAMASLGAELNLQPTLVATQDDCALGTYEGFGVIGGWVNPGTGYAASASTPLVSVAQILYPTSVISFNGFIVPKKGGDPSAVGTPHYDYSFPLLPTSLAVCTGYEVEIALGIAPTTLSTVPFLSTGSGNVGDPPVRQLLPETGTFSWTLELLSGPSTLISSDSPTCTIAASTASPGTPCGDG